MKPIKVNGVVVCCSNCINHQVSPLDEPCKDCWKAIFHSGNIDEVRLDDIVFYPADKERFLTLEKEAKAWSVMILYPVMRIIDTNLSVKARTKKSSASVQRWSE